MIRNVLLFLNCDNLSILQDIHIHPLTAYRKLLLLTVECNITSKGKEIHVSTDSDYACSITHQFLNLKFNDPNRAADPIPSNGNIVACALA